VADTKDEFAQENGTPNGKGPASGSDQRTGSIGGVCNQVALFLNAISLLLDLLSFGQWLGLSVGDTTGLTRRIRIQSIQGAINNLHSRPGNDAGYNGCLKGRQGRHGSKAHGRHERWLINGTQQTHVAVAVSLLVVCR
jgi:hypothetical protein